MLLTLFSYSGKADEEMMVENQATGLGEQLGNPAADA